MAENTVINEQNPRKTYEELESEVKRLSELLTKAYGLIMDLDKKLKKYEQPQDEYNKKWSWITKIAFIIEKADKPLRSSDIIAALSLREPVLERKLSKEQFVSVFLNSGKKHGRLIAYKVKGERGYFYCLPEWMDDNGGLMPQFKSRLFK